MTPQMALQQTMAAMNAKAQALTGIALPKYYNPAAVNPLKYAEQVQKRKLLWQSSDKVEVSLGEIFLKILKHSTFYFPRHVALQFPIACGNLSPVLINKYKLA